jgi:hypothetical protein
MIPGSVRRLPSVSVALVWAAGCSAITGLDDFTLDSGSGPGGSSLSAGPGAGGSGQGGSAATAGGGAGSGGSAIACDAPWGLRLASSDNARDASVAIDAMGHGVLATGFKGAADIGGQVLNAGYSHDVLLVMLDQNGSPSWARGFGSTDKNKMDYATSVALDPSGNLILTGVCDSDIDLGGGAIALGSGPNTFVAKLDTNGGHIWSFGFERAVGRAIAVGGGAHPVVAGHHVGAVTVAQPGDIPLQLPYGGASDAFVIKLNGETNEVMWAHAYGDSMAQNSAGVAVVPLTGDVHLIGSFEGSMNIDPASMTQLTSADEFDAFLLKLDQAGSLVWGKRFGGTKTQTGVAVATAPDGTAVITGTFEQEIALDAYTFTADGLAEDIYVAKLDASGNVLWASSFGDSQQQYARAVALDDQGRIYLTGAFKGTIDFGGGLSITAQSHLNVFVAVLGPDGAAVDARAFPADKDQWGTAIAPDTCGNIVLAGTYDEVLDPGSGPLPADPAGPKSFLAKLLRGAP